MFRLILLLPFDTCLVLAKEFATQEAADEFAKQLPGGFIAVHKQEVPIGAVEVPFQ